MSNNTIS